MPDASPRFNCFCEACENFKQQLYDSISSLEGVTVRLNGTLMAIEYDEIAHPGHEEIINLLIQRYIGTYIYRLTPVPGCNKGLERR